MKKPQSLYLSALAHNRLTTYVENALDGAGSLSGFIAYIEERTHAMLERTEDLPSDHEANEKYASLASLDFHDLRYPLTVYRDAWDEFTTALPWFEANSVGAHALALQPLREFPSLWETEYRRRDRPRHPLEAHRASISMAIEAMRAPYIPSAPSIDPQDGWNRARPIVGRDRIDFVTSDRHVPVSIYLDAAAHHTFYAAFGNGFFTRLEHALINLLEDPEAVVDIEPEAQFLEIGPEGVDLDELQQTADEITRTMAMRRGTGNPAGRPLTDEAIEAQAMEQGYASLQDPALLRDGLAYLYLRKRDVDRTSGYDIWSLTPDVAEGTLATLHAANRLGLIDESDLRLLPQRISKALSERYGITEIAPTRNNAVRIIAATVGNNETPITFANAVDFHMWSLFLHYVRNCLPQVPIGHARFNHRALATLAEADLFPRSGAIQAFSGAAVRKTLSGTWQVKKGRKVHAELDHPSFLKVGDALCGLIELRDPITVVDDWGDEQIETHSIQDAEPFSYPVSPTVIEQTLQVASSVDDAGLRKELKRALQEHQPPGKPGRREPKSTQSGTATELRKEATK